MDSTRPSFALGIQSIKRSFVDARNRGVKLRYLTEITDANISYCKELMSIVDEVRHLDGIKGNFMVSEIEYLAPATSHEETKLATLIYSSVREIVEHQQYVFETLWNKSMSAEKRIRELKQGITTRYQTKVIEDPDEVVKEISRQIANSNELCACLTSGGMEYSYAHFFEIRKKLLEKQKKGEHKGFRYITNVTQDNVNLVKVFLEAGIRIRHGFIAHSFNDASQALENFMAGVYDLVIVDVIMQGMNGFSLYDEIRKLDYKVPMCFLTAADDLYYETLKKSYINQ
jgi:CheY-like chemotaxis protein